MAAKKGAVSKSAGLDELKADLKAETLKNAYIFYGEETYLRQSYLDQVREALVPAGFEEFNYHRLGGKGLSMQALQETTPEKALLVSPVVDMETFITNMMQGTNVTEAQLQAAGKIPAAPSCGS